MGILLLIAIPLPLIFLASAWHWNWPIFPVEKEQAAAGIWSVAGVILGYYSVLFSGYAAYQVKELSQKYYARTRFPQIKENLDAITKEMATAASKKASDLRKERFLSTISVSLGEVERVPGHNMSELIDRAKNEKKTLIEWLDNENNNNSLANSQLIYWNLFRTLQEISDEISAYIKEQVAK